MFTAQDVKELREITGAGMMDCKKALTECLGDKEKAVDFLRTKGLASAAKKQSRIAADGQVVVVGGAGYGALLEVNCETDFVSKSTDFQNFCAEVMKEVAANKVRDLSNLLELTIAGTDLATYCSNLILKVGEKVHLRRFQAIHNPMCFYSSYSHGGKIGVILEINASNSLFTNQDFLTLSKDIALHVAASDCRFVNASEMDENFIKRESEIYTNQLREQGKPEQMIPGIVKGKVAKLASEVCLMEQKFVKNPDLTVASYIQNSVKALNSEITVVKFIKFNLGEGVEKKEENFAEEIAKLTKSN
jgi:elongation factor Ts